MDRNDYEERRAIQEEPSNYASACPPNSFVTQYVNYAQQRTDAPLEAHELMAVGLLSALAGPTARLPIATSVNGWPLCLWVLYVVNSTTGRKTTVIDIARDVAHEALGHRRDSSISVHLPRSGTAWLGVRSRIFIYIPRKEPRSFVKPKRASFPTGRCGE